MAIAGPGETTDLLRRVSIFAHLGEADLASLARITRARECASNEVVVGEADAGEALFVLARGRVKVVRYGASGREVILSVFKTPGDFFGEMSLLDDQPRSATVLASEPSRLLFLARRDFREHLEANPRTALAVLTELSRRLRRADEVIGNLALLDVHGRVARWLREVAASDGVETEEGVLVPERPTQQEIASMVGTSRETVSRVLSEFGRRGLVEMSGKRLLLRRAFLAGGTQEE